MTSPRVLTNKDIIARAADLYEELETLPSVREHQARVAAVVLALKQRWRSDAPRVDWDNAVAAALVHDLGNIVKADLSTPLSQEILGPEECERLDYWEDVKKRTIALYGSDEDVVTLALCRHVGVSERISTIATHIGFAYGSETLHENDWTLKVAAYADRVVGPFGVLTFEKRLHEAADRYGFPRYAPHERPPLVQAAYALKEELQAHVSAPLDSITDDDVRADVQRFLRRD